MVSKSWKIWLILTLILALGIRIFMVRYENDIGVDSYHYALMGHNILHGQFDTYDPNGGRWTLPPVFPVIVAIFNSFIPDVETAGRAASMLSGILTCLFIFFITGKLFDKKTGLVAAFLCAITPILTDYSVLVLTETTFAMLYALTLLFSHLTFEKPKVWVYPLLTGITCALMYQTKAYGISFILFALFIVIIGNRYKFKIGSSFVWKSLALILVGWLLLVIPYWIFLYNYHGKFVLDGKAVGQLSRMFAHDIPDERLDPRYSGEMIKLDDGRWDYAILHEETIRPPKPLDFAKWFVHKYIKKLIQIFWDFPTMFSYPDNIPLLNLLLIMLIGLGLFTRPLNSRNNFPAIFVLLWTLPYFTVLPMVFIEVRYYIPLVAILNIFAALGAISLAGWLASCFPMFDDKSFYKKYALVIVLVGIFIFFLPKNTLKATHASEPDVFYNEYKVAANWLEETYNPLPEPIIEYAHSVSFYSDVRGLQLPDLDPDQLVEFARQRDVKLIVLDEQYTYRHKKRPSLNILFQNATNNVTSTGSLKLVYRDIKYPQHELFIYEVQPENAEAE